MSANGTRGRGHKRERLRERAIDALLRCGSVREAAQEVGVAPSTLLRWLQDPTFREAFERARSRLLDAAVLRLQQAVGDAVTTLVRNMASGHPATEVAAARAVLDAALKWAEGVELRQRVEALEDRLGGGAPAGAPAVGGDGS